MQTCYSWHKKLMTSQRFIDLLNLLLKHFCRETMGRRKSKRKPPPKKKMTGNLDTQFTCPFCNHEKSCDVKMSVPHCNSCAYELLAWWAIWWQYLFSRERTRNTGIISCSVCLEEFQTPITCILFDLYKRWYNCSLFYLTWIGSPFLCVSLFTQIHSGGELM